jgi:putative hydrolase of the HAD superfamily
MTDRRVDAVLLDLYETLAWFPDGLGSRASLAARVGVEPAQLRAAFIDTYHPRARGITGSVEGDWRIVLEACGVRVDDALLAEVVAQEETTWRSGVKLYDDAVRALSRLRERAYRTAIVSNCSRQTGWVADSLGLHRAVDEVILSFEVAAAKPEPRIFQIALERLGVQPARAVFVDDQTAYLDGARALGIQTILIMRPSEQADPAGIPTEIEPEGDGHRSIASLDELDPLLG